MDLGVSELPEEGFRLGKTRVTRQPGKDRENLGFHSLEAETGQASEQPPFG